MQQDQRQPELVSSVAARWQKLWGPRIDSPRAYASKARSWGEESPKVMDPEVLKVIALGAEAARDFSGIPLGQLESARPDGLAIHPTVYSGLAITNVIGMASTWTAGLLQAHDLIDQDRRGLGLSEESHIPGKYRFEMLARVLESALALAQFRPGALARPQSIHISLKRPPTS